MGSGFRVKIRREDIPLFPTNNQQAKLKALNTRFKPSLWASVPQVDVFSYAMVIYEIICREVPFEEEDFRHLLCSHRDIL